MLEDTSKKDNLFVLLKDFLHPVEPLAQGIVLRFWVWLWALNISSKSRKSWVMLS